MLALTLVALSVGLSNLAAAVGIGAAGVDRATRLRVGVIFGLYETGMPIVGLLLGHDLAASIGRRADWLAGALLVAVGGYMIVSGLRAGHDADGAPRPPRPAPSGLAETLRLSLSALALSADNLVAGFALGTYRVSLVAGALTFGVVSVVLSLVGLEFGARIGKRAGERGQLVGGVIVVAVGLAAAFGVLG